MANKDQYALIEQGSVHSEWLNRDEANEMLERHKRIFPEISWEIVPMSEVGDKEKLKGYLESQREIAKKYHC